MANAAAKKAAAGKFGLQNSDLAFFVLQTRSCDLIFAHVINLFITARQSASSTYLPIVAALDLLYLILFAIYKRPSLTIFQCVMSVTLLALSYLSYKGVVDNYANNDFKNNKNSDALAGGAYLDMMGLVSVVQFGSVLLSDKFYWLLLLIPIVGGLKIYKTVKGGMPGMPNATAAAPSAGNGHVSEKDNERRQKRAERRRRKW